MPTCKYCHKDYVQKRRKRTQQFCCRQCLYSWMHEFSDQKKPREKRECVVCHKLFEEFCHRPRTHCSMRCAHQSRVGSHLSIEHRKIISETRKRDWANGITYANVCAARTKWYDHIKPNGDVIRLQGTWELAYAKYLDEQEITYLAHKGAIWYTRSADNTKRVYLPDFHLLDTDVYLDIKNDYLLRIDQQKFKDIRTCNPTLKLKIITKSELILLNILQKD